MPVISSQTSTFLTYYGAGYATCLILSGVYVWMDFAQDQEPIPPNVLIKNPYFYLYWLLQVIASTLAFYLLLSYQPVKNWLSPFIAMVAVFGSSMVLQNQLVKIGNKPVIDLSGFQKGLRLQVVAEGRKIGAKQQTARIVKITEKLAAKFQKKELEPDAIFIRVMSFGGVEADEIRKKIVEIKDRSKLLEQPPEYELARIIVRTDIDYAIRILHRLER